MSSQLTNPLNPLSAVALARPATTGQPQGAFNPTLLFQQAQYSLLNPYATGYSPATPLYGGMLQPAVAVAQYSRATAAGLARVKRSWSTTTVAARERVQHEFTRWLNSLPAIFCKSWQTVDPLDIISFMESVWLTRHAGTQLPDGKGKVVAPSSLSGRCSPPSPLTPPPPPAHFYSASALPSPFLLVASSHCH